MEYARLIINYNGQWDKSVYGFYSYRGGSSKGMRVPKNLNYTELLERIISLVNVDLSKYEVKLKSVFQTSYRSPLVEINDDNDVEFLLCEDRVIPQVGVSLVKKVDQSSKGVDLHDVQLTMHQTRAEATHVPSASEGNQVSGSMSATLPSQCTSPIGEGCPTYYSDDPTMNHIENKSSDNEDGASNHDFNPNMEDDNGLVEPGLCLDSVNTGHHNDASSDPTPFHIPRAAAFTSEDLSAFAPMRSDNYVYKHQIFPNKKELRRVLEVHALKGNFDFRVKRSTTKRFEVVCSDIECQWRLAARKIAQGSQFQVKRYDSKHTCALDKTQRRRWQAKARKASKRPRKQTTLVMSEPEVRQNQCGKCGGLGHNRIRCKNLVLPENSTPQPPIFPGEKRRKCTCRTCGATGHNRQSCPNWEPPISNENQDG